MDRKYWTLLVLNGIQWAILLFSWHVWYDIAHESDLALNVWIQSAVIPTFELVPLPLKATTAIVLASICTVSIYFSIGYYSIRHSLGSFVSLLSFKYPPIGSYLIARELVPERSTQIGLALLVTYILLNMMWSGQVFYVT